MKQKTLEEHSENYQTNVKPYDEFKQAEDCPGRVISVLNSKVINQIVLDIGCGEGSHAKVLARQAKQYIALDSSAEQLKRARINCKGFTNIKFIHASGERINLANDSVNLIICAWSISVIKGLRRRSQVIKEALRILKPGGEIILVENDWRGEFEDIRQHPIRTKRYNEWLSKQGFTVSKNIDTYFQFPNRTIAKEIFRQIWGTRVSNKITSAKVQHKVIIFSLTKSLSKK